MVADQKCWEEKLKVALGEGNGSKARNFAVVEVSKLLALLPDTLLAELAVETKVNYYSKKLQGQVLFKLLLYCMLCYKDNSLRVMQSAYESIGFRLLQAAQPKGAVHYSSISERLDSINPAYFEKLYKASIALYQQQAVQEQQTAIITRFDSTIVALSGALLKIGYHLKGGGADHVRQLKFTIALSDIPLSAHFFYEQAYTSENVALKEAILHSVQPERTNDIRVFDRGITSRKTYDDFIEKKIPFITRINTQSNYEELLPNTLQKPLDTSTLTIISISDNWAYLFSRKVRSKHPLRLIRAVKKSSGEELVFATNIADLSTEVVTILYKRRWDIEVFFKFLKQELNCSHLINRSENGIQVLLYTTMIAAILLLIYKKVNNLSGYKIVKHQFIHQLESALIKDFVLLCGGHPELVEQLLNKPSPL